MRIIIFILIFLAIGCGKDNGRSSSKKSLVVDSALTKTPNLELDSIDVRATIDATLTETFPVVTEHPMSGVGVVVVKFQGSRAKLTLLNLDESVYCVLDLSGKLITTSDKQIRFDEFDSDLFDSSLGLTPRQFQLEYETIHFDCAFRGEEFYEVIVNRSSGATKKIRIDPSTLEFLTWEQYVMKAYILFDPNTNPLKEKPTNESRTVYHNNDFFFTALGVEGDWMKVKCNSDCRICERGDLVGWIKWRNGNKFLVQIGFFC